MDAGCYAFQVGHGINRQNDSVMTEHRASFPQKFRSQLLPHVRPVMYLSVFDLVLGTVNSIECFIVQSMFFCDVEGLQRRMDNLIRGLVAATF